MRYYISHLQAVEPDALSEVDGITVTVLAEDSAGFPCVSVEGPTTMAVLDYVRDNWGDDDPDWFQSWVVDRVERIDSQPRTILVHLNVEVPPTDHRSPQMIADDIMGALDRFDAMDEPDSESGDDWYPLVRDLTITVPLTEEV